MKEVLFLIAILVGASYANKYGTKAKKDIDDYFKTKNK